MSKKYDEKQKWLESERAKGSITNICRRCGRPYSGDIRYHFAEYPTFICSKCGAKFCGRDDLQQHLNKHMHWPPPEDTFQLRWSDGYSHAMEFSTTENTLAEDMIDALTNFRKSFHNGLVFLHVRVSEDRWTDPYKLHNIGKSKLIPNGLLALPAPFKASGSLSQCASDIINIATDLWENIVLASGQMANLRHFFRDIEDGLS